MLTPYQLVISLLDSKQKGKLGVSCFFYLLAAVFLILAWRHVEKSLNHRAKYFSKRQNTIQLNMIIPY